MNDNSRLRLHPDVYKKDLANLLSWQEIKLTFPAVRDFFIKEYKAVNGFIPREPGYIYVLKAVGTNYYKIGKSIEPDRRILEIAPKMPFDVRFAWVIRTEFMSLAESRLHDIYEDHRANGEWFLFENDITNYFEGEHHVFPIRYAYFDRFEERLAGCISVNYPFEGKSLRPLRDKWEERSCADCLYFKEFSVSWIERIFFEIERDKEISLTMPFLRAVGRAK